MSTGNTNQNKQFEKMKDGNSAIFASSSRGIIIEHEQEQEKENFSEEPLEEKNMQSHKRRPSLRHTNEQIQAMEMLFRECPYPNITQYQDMCVRTGLTLLQIRKWFLNKRRRIKERKVMTHDPSSITSAVQLTGAYRPALTQDSTPVFSNTASLAAALQRHCVELTAGCSFLSGMGPTVSKERYDNLKEKFKSALEERDSFKNQLDQTQLALVELNASVKERTTKVREDIMRYHEERHQAMQAMYQADLSRIQAEHAQYRKDEETRRELAVQIALERVANGRQGPPKH